MNLRREGIPTERIHFVGNVMIDTLLKQLPAARGERAYERFQVRPREYIVLTLHRPSNVDEPARLTEILRAVTRLNRDYAVLFVVHPRTQAKIAEFGLTNDPAAQRVSVDRAAAVSGDAVAERIGAAGDHRLRRHPGGDDDARRAVPDGAR